MGTNKWTQEDIERTQSKVERTEEILFDARRRDIEPVVLKVDFKTGELLGTFDSSNIQEYHAQEKLNSRKKAA